MCKKHCIKYQVVKVSPGSSSKGVRGGAKGVKGSEGHFRLSFCIFCALDPPLLPFASLLTYVPSLPLPPLVA